MAIAKRILCAALIAVIAVWLSPCAVALLGSQSPTIPYEIPRVIVEDFKVEGGGLVSGAVCELTVTLRNTSSTISVSSVLITGRWTSDSLPPVDFEMRNQAYVSGIGPLQKQTIVFRLKTKPVNVLALDSVPMYLDIVYSYDQLPNNSNTVLLQLPIGDAQSTQPELLMVDAPVHTGYLAGLPFLDFLQDYLSYIFICGSVLFALVAARLILLRRRRH